MCCIVFRPLLDENGGGSAICCYAALMNINEFSASNHKTRKMRLRNASVWAFTVRVAHTHVQYMYGVTPPPTHTRYTCPRLPNALFIKHDHAYVTHCDQAEPWCVPAWPSRSCIMHTLIKHDITSPPQGPIVASLRSGLISRYCNEL